MEESIDRQVAKALDDFKKWGTIADLLEFVSERVAIPEDVRHTAINKMLTGVIRRQIKLRHDRDGLSEFESIERMGDDGESVRVYKQIALFDKGEFHEAIAYYSDRTNYNARKANSLTKRCNDVHGTRRQLPFPGFGTLKDSQDAAQKSA